MPQKSVTKPSPKSTYEWRKNIACVATYNTLEGDQFLDQFEDADIPFEDAADVKMSQLRYFPQTTDNANILELLGIEMAREFIRQVSKTFTLRKQTPDTTPAGFLREVSAIFSNAERTLRELAEVMDKNVKFPDET